MDGKKRTIRGDGHTPVLAILGAFRADLDVELDMGEFASQNDHSDQPAFIKTVTFLEVLSPGCAGSQSGVGSVWGVGISSDVTTSKLRAIVSGANGIIGDSVIPGPKKTFVSRPALSSDSRSWLCDVKMRSGYAALPSPESPAGHTLIPIETST